MTPKLRPDLERADLTYTEQNGFDKHADAPKEEQKRRCTGLAWAITSF